MPEDHSPTAENCGVHNLNSIRIQVLGLSLGIGSVAYLLGSCSRIHQKIAIAASCRLSACPFPAFCIIQAIEN